MCQCVGRSVPMRSHAVAPLLRLPLLLLMPWTAARSGLGALAALLLDEDFSCRMMGCDSHRITNLTYWRHSTTGSNQSYMSIGPASGGRTGNEVNFSVSWCRPPHPNPQELGCYRSELALQRDVQATLIDWTRGEGSSQRCASTAHSLHFCCSDSELVDGAVRRVWLLKQAAKLHVGDHRIYARS